MSDEAWQLGRDERDETVRRVAENLFSLAYSRKKLLSDKDASDIAQQFEEVAHNTAKIQSKNTSGRRPDHESLQAYTRILAQKVVDWLGKGTAETSQHQPESKEEYVLAGDREFMSRELAEKAFAPLLVEGSAFKRIKLSTKSFGAKDDSAATAARALEAQKHSLVDVDLSDVIAGRDEKEALAALQILSRALGNLNLQRLDLSDNALGEKGLRACSQAFSNQGGLQFLGLQNVGCSINACSALKELLKYPKHLTSLHFYNNMSDSAGASSIAEILSSAPLMADFKMGSSRVGAEGGIALSKGLRAGNSLVKLDLSDNPMTADMAEDLAETLKGHPDLKVLILNDMSLTDEGVGCILAALKDSAPELEQLELALNEITPEGAKAFGSVLPLKKKLKVLNLRENEFEDVGAIWLAKAISSLEGLESLDLTQNQIKRAGAVAIARAVCRSKSTFKSLALDENEISDTGIDNLKEVLKSTGLLQALGTLENNDADADEDDDAEEIEDDNAEDDLTAAFAKAGIN